MPVGGFVPPTWGDIFCIVIAMLLVIGVPLGLGIWALAELVEYLR